MFRINLTRNFPNFWCYQFHSRSCQDQQLLYWNLSHTKIFIIYHHNQTFLNAFVVQNTFHLKKKQIFSLILTTRTATDQQKIIVVIILLASMKNFLFIDSPSQSNPYNTTPLKILVIYDTEYFFVYKQVVKNKFILFLSYPAQG